MTLLSLKHTTVPVSLYGGTGTQRRDMFRADWPKQFLLACDPIWFQRAGMRAYRQGANDIDVGITVVVKNQEHGLLSLAKFHELPLLVSTAGLEISVQNTEPTAADFFGAPQETLDQLSIRMTSWQRRSVCRICISTVRPKKKRDHSREILNRRPQIFIASAIKNTERK